MKSVIVKNNFIPSIQGQLAYTIICEAMSRPPRKRQRQQRAPRSSAPLTAADRNGPRDMCERDMWPEQLVQDLECAGLWKQISQTLQQGWVLTTDYSGIGTAEEAARCLSIAANAQAHGQGKLEYAARLFCQRGGDKEADCRQMLLERDHMSTHGLACVHGDIGERCDRQIWEDLHQKVQRLQTSEVLRLETDPEEFAKACFARVMKQDLRGVKAHCFRHSQMCSVSRSSSGAKVAEADDALKIHAAGFNCFDWSLMGGRKGWFGLSTPAFVQWLAERMQFDEDDCILCENTPTFDIKTLSELTAEKWHMQVISVSPTLFGIPVERKRIYIILLRKGKLRFQGLGGVGCGQEQAEQNHFFLLQERFDSVFHRNTVMTVGSQFRAPESFQKRHVQDLVQAQKLPSTTASGKQWSCFQAVSAAVRCKINEHKQALLEKSGQVWEDMTQRERDQWTADLCQHPQYMGPTCGHVPALLQRTNLWLFGQRRLALPSEHLECQGWNLFGDPASVYKSPIKIEQLQQMKPGRVKSFAGNGMHMQVIAAVLAFIIGIMEKESSP